MTTTDATTDRIEKQTVLRAPRSRVWRALTDPAEFGAWFGCAFDGDRFTPGKTARGRITTPGYEHVPMVIVIDRVEPERLFSYRWHPYAVDPAHDFSQEPTTTVTFTLEEVPEGTRLTIVESGFDALPLARRAEARDRNEPGWTAQLRNIAGHVESAR